MVQQSSGRFGSIIKSDRSFYKVQEGLGRFKNVQKGSRRLKQAQEGSRRLKKVYFGWVVNSEGYGMIASFTD